MKTDFISFAKYIFIQSARHPVGSLVFGATPVIPRIISLLSLLLYRTFCSR